MLSEIETPSVTLESVLSGTFHLPAFRSMQCEAIENVLRGNDTLVIMPTGGGKSLCYQLPAVILPGITLVVSPLIALMQDQVERLRQLGVEAVALNSTLTYAETRALVRRAQTGTTKLLFVAPERLESFPFVEELAHLPISRLAIDEAHCISQWGHDFRTSYRRIPEVYSRFANGARPPIIALTATATPDVRADISELLQLRNPLEIVTGFERPNLAYGVLRQCDKDVRLRDILRSVEGAAIVYTSSRKSVDRIASDLRTIGIAAEGYHAGLPLRLRSQIQERFRRNETSVMVATSAFGMGVDKSDVRAVIHYDIPGSLEAYYQEAGRAGRDGERAHAVLLYNDRDRSLQEALIRSNSPEEAEVKAVYTALHEIAGTPVGSLYQGMLSVQSSQITDRVPKPRAAMDSILEALVQSGHVEFHRGLAMNERPRIRFTATRARLDEIAFRSASKSVKNTISALLRTLDAEAFERDVFFEPDELMKRHDLDRDDFKLAIRTIEGLGLIRYTAAQRTKSDVYHLSLTSERAPVHHLDVGGHLLEARLEANMAKLEAMVAYAVEWNCRQLTILQYFGERSKANCGVCDVCVATSSRSSR